VSGQTIALAYDPWSGLEDALASRRHPLLLWRKAMWFKANPRPPAYMRARLEEHWPEAKIVAVAADARWAETLSGAERVVLLYPDAIGIGFGAIERRLLAVVPRGAVTVLNGRRRIFPLDRPSRRGLLLRRVLERSMLVECAAGAVILVLTPILFCVDFAAGRR
jgi:hypothetical protein